MTTVFTNIVVDKSTDHTKPLVFLTTIPTSNKTILSVRDHCVDASSVVCTLSIRQIDQSDCDITALHPRPPVPHYRVKWKIDGSFKLRIADFRVLYENTFYHPRWLKIRDTDFVVSLLEAEFWFFTIFQVTQTEAIRSFIDEHFARVQKQSITIYPCLASEAFHLACGGKFISAFYSSRLSLCRKLFLMQNTLNLKTKSILVIR